MHCCCDGGEPASPGGAPRRTTAASLLRRAGAAVEWGLPIATLALIPKCPACVAAYVLLFTGVGLSFSGAAALRWGLIALSVLALALLLVRAARRMLARGA